MLNPGSCLLFRARMFRSELSSAKCCRPSQLPLHKHHRLPFMVAVIFQCTVSCWLWVKCSWLGNFICLISADLWLVLFVPNSSLRLAFRMLLCDQISLHGY